MSAGALAVLLAVPADHRPNRRRAATAAAASTAAASAAPSRRRPRPARTTTCPSSRASPATSSTSPCSAASRPKPRSSASPSTPRARRSSTPPCRSRSSTLWSPRKPDALLIAPTDVTAMQTPLRTPPPPASRWCWSTPPSRTRRSPSPRSPRTTRVAGPRRSTPSRQQEPQRRQGARHLHRPRHLHRRRPRQGLRRRPPRPTPAFNYLGVQYSHNDPATAAQLVTAALQKDPDIVGIFATNLFSAEGTATGVKQAGKGDQITHRRLRRRPQPGQGPQGGHRPGPGRPAARH